jgi:glycosyltransferase involved in cell wall biosynthesis
LKIGIYNEPAGTGIGGSEHMSAVMAEALAGKHQVDLLHHIPGLSAERLAATSGTNLGGVRLRYFKPEAEPPVRSRDPRRRYEAARRWHAALGEGYDLFVAVVHDKPPVCRARRGALVVLFPAYASFYAQPLGGVLWLKSALRQPFEHFYQRWEWRRRMEGYQLKTAISEFSREWALRRWGVDCRILHPPVDDDFGPAEKEDVILSVGRFALPAGGHTKKQAEMLGAFRQMTEGGLTGWEYVCAGGLADTPEHRAYFDGLRRAGAESGASVVANLPRAELKRLFERAKIFWHAAGYGEEEDRHPELSEHFGIATVEAMAAGCVPVVVNKGGQREIVEHGASGFLWDTVEELKGYTEALVRDEPLRARMSGAARERARLFGREEFVKKFLTLLRPLLTA